MKPAFLVLVFLCLSSLVLAQDVELQHRKAPKINDLSVPDKPEPLTAEEITPDSSIPEGMVFVPEHRGKDWKWLAREQGSCAWCGRPMTFKQAAFDKKMSFMWLAEIGLSIADTEIMESRKCVKDRTCREGNFFLGPSRAQQYGIRMPVLVGAWMLTARLRQGNTKYKVGGLRRWWILPALHQAATTAGIASNLGK